MRLWPKIALLILIIAQVAVLNVQAQSTGPGPMAEVGIDQKLNGDIPLDAVFRDENGQEHKLGDYFGKKPIIIAPVYYNCPMLCTLILNGLVQSLNAVPFEAGKEFEVVAFSIDAREKPELAAKKKASYLDHYSKKGTAAGWHFLTSDEASIKRLTAAIGFRYKYDEKSDQFAHASGIMVATPQGKLARYFYGIEYSPRDLRFGLVEASENKIGSPVDQILLLCFHYDPATGKYGPMVLGSLRIAASITVIALAAFLFAMWKMEKRKKREWQAMGALDVINGESAQTVKNAR